MSEPAFAIYLYQVAHSHQDGDNAELVWSYSPDIDLVDLMLSDRSCYEPERADETVLIDPVPGALNTMVNAASDDVLAELAVSMNSVRKASREERQAVLAGLNEDEIISAGLDDYSA